MSVLQQLLDEVDSLGSLQDLHQEIGLIRTDLYNLRAEFVDGSGHVDVRSFFEGNWNEAYDQAVKHILETRGFNQYANPHVGGDGPRVQGFRGTSQVCVPGIYFPPGHYDFNRTLVLHPQIPVFGAGRSTRWWFKGKAEDYITDDATWNGSSLAPNTRKLPVAICAPHSVIHQNGQEWMGYEVNLRSVNVKFMIEGPGCNGIGVFGHQHNLHLEDLHLVTDTGRDKSIAVNLLPSSIDRELPWGAKMGQSWVKPDNHSKGLSCHLLDADMKDLFLEFWQTGVCYTGIKCRLVGRSVYTQVGFHNYGQSGWGKDSQDIQWISDSEFPKDGPSLWQPDECLAGIITVLGDSIVSVASHLPMWANQGQAPETRGGFTQGKRIW